MLLPDIEKAKVQMNINMRIFIEIRLTGIQGLGGVPRWGTKKIPM